MTDAKKPMSPWLATLLGLIAFLLLSNLVGTTAHPGIFALALLIATAAGGYLASRLSRRRTPAWIVAALGLLVAISYVVVHGVDPALLPVWFGQQFQQRVLPLWLAASVLGSPLLGGRIGEAGAGR